MSGIVDLRKQASQLQRHGRGYDDTLVHMNRKELAGLEALANKHGGSLTINPKTGLPEAGFLSSILPMVASAVGFYFGGPGGAALAGGLTGAATSKNPMMGGIMGALGGWGASSLYGSLMEAGLTAAEAAPIAEMAASNTAALSTSQIPSSLALQSSPAANPLYESLYAGADTTIGDIAREITPAATGANAFTGMPTDQYVNLANSGGNALGASSTINPVTGIPLGQTVDLANSAGPFVPNTSPSMVGAGGFDQLWQGAKNIGSAAMKDPKTLKQYMMPAAAAGASMLYGGAGGQNQSGLNPLAQQSSGSRYSYNPIRPKTDIFGRTIPGEYTNSSFTRLAAQGGIMGLAGGGGAPNEPRMIRGQGDGLSDSVPAVIDGMRPAALASGEFVVPADVVSAAGAGSTDAGAEKFYALMDRVRQQAHGTKKQVRKVNLNKVMPV